MLLQTITQALIIFVINTLLGSALFIAVRRRIQAAIEEWITDTVHDYIQEQLKITLENPEATVKALKPLLQALINELMKEVPKDTNQLVKVPFLGKIPAPLLQSILGKFLGGKPNTENPFA